MLLKNQIRQKCKHKRTDFYNDNMKNFMISYDSV